MAKKPVTKKKTTPRRGASSRDTHIGTMKGGVFVQGNINAKKVVLGNEYNDYRKQIAQIATPQQFIAEAEKMQTQIAKAKTLPALPPAQARRLDAIEGDVKDVIAEAKKDAPNPKTMSDTLKTAAETMEGVGKAVAAAQGMGEKITQAVDRIDFPRLVVGATALADLAVRIFGSLPH